MPSVTDFAPPLGQLTTFTDFAPGELSTLAAPIPLLTPNVDLYTTVDVVNTTSATDLFDGAVTVPGGYLGSKGAIEIVCGGDYLNNTGATKTIRLVLIFGSQTLYDSDVSDTQAASATRRAWHLRARIQAMNSVMAQRGSGIISFSDDNAPVTGTGVLHRTASTIPISPYLTIAGTVDTTLPQNLALKVIHSAASSSLSMRLLHGHIEMITSNR